MGDGQGEVALEAFNSPVHPGFPLRRMETDGISAQGAWLDFLGHRQSPGQDHLVGLLIGAEGMADHS